MKKYNVKQSKELKDKSKVKFLTCNVNWDTKSLTKDASGKIKIKGWANTSDKDRIGDVVLPSAFEKTMAEYMGNPVLLYQHNWEQIIGKVVSYEIVNDSQKETNGLFIEAELSDAKDVEDVKTKIKEGILQTFSIGYNEVDSDYDKETNTNFVKELELLEISVVTIPCNPFAKFDSSEPEGKSTNLDEKLLNFISETVRQLKDVNEVSGDFLKEIINIYNEGNV